MDGKWKNCLGLLLTLVHLTYQVRVVETHQPQLINTDTGIPIVDILTDELFKKQNEPSASMSPQKDYYIGAVVEYEGRYVKNDADATLQENVNVLSNFIKEASEQGADIIVLPEYGVTSLGIPFGKGVEPWLTAIPSAKEEYVPCTGNRADVSKAMKRLSCAAKENRIYVVANIAEKEACDRKDPRCPSRGAYYYNANVVFDRMGKVIARYRKVNLFMEDLLFNVTEEPEIVVFDTDFGVKFGTFICFDILFPTPTLNLTRNLGVKNFVYPVAWGSEVPFLTAPQVHGGWAFAENVNLLASGYYRVMGGSSGSGIYLGRAGIGDVTFSESNAKLVIARVPKTPKQVPNADVEMVEEPTIKRKPLREINISELEKSDVPYNTHNRWEMIRGLNTQRDYITAFASALLFGSMNNTICYESFCCHFNVETAVSDPLPNYRAVVYEGTRMFGLQASAGIRTCGLIQCANSSIVSCGSVDYSNTLFTNLEITTKLHDYSKVLAFPTMVNSTLYPFDDNWTFNAERNGKDTTLSLSLDSPMKDIVAFGIYIRDYSRDEWINQIPQGGGVGGI